MYYMILLNIVIGIAQSTNYLVDDSQLNRPVIKVNQGQLRGIQEKNINGNDYFYAFRGIPYAKIPVGELRFKDSESAEPWSDIKEAKEFGNICVQYDRLETKTVGNEDCLFLNVYSTNLNPDIPRAVMVWIHGGSFIFGSGNDDIFGPDYLMEKDIILVTINYRLDIFGFLNLDDEEAPGNQGLKDQVMALKWVQQNIAQFGGDPNLVTIFGESAGAASVHYLTLSPLAQGLFHRAIMQSAVATDPWASSLGTMKEEAQKISNKLGNEINDSKELAKYLRSIDSYTIMDTKKLFISWKNRYLLENTFTPSVDLKSSSPFLTIPIQEAVKFGITVPHIIGYNSHEGILFLKEVHDENKYPEIDANQNTLLLNPKEIQFLQERNITVSDVKQFFMGNNHISRETAQQFVNLTTAGLFVINIHDVISIQSNIPDAQTYVYKFDYYLKDTAIVQKLVKIDLEGTSHTEDLYYLFNVKLLKKLDIKPTTSNPVTNIIKQRFIELWTNFAKIGNPNSELSELITLKWEPNNSPTEFLCLEISDDLNLIKQPNILDQLSNSIQDKY